MKLISVVVPMYNEEEMAPIFMEAVTSILDTLTNYKYEIIAVNDGSKDSTLNVLFDLKKQYKNLVIVNLSRNWGHEAALFAGLKEAKGDAIIPMDADLQDPPSVIPEMVKMWEEGYQVVNAKRKSRDEDTFLKRKTAGLFYKIINKISKKVRIPENVANFRLIDRKPLDHVLALSEKSRIFRIQVPYVGFKVGEVYFSRPERQKGKSKYNVNAMTELAIASAVSVTTRPLDWAFKAFIALLGVTTLSWITEIVFFIISLCKGSFELYSIYYLIGLVINIMLLLTTLIMGFIAIICMYLSKNYMETSNRPTVIVDEVYRD